MQPSSGQPSGQPSGPSPSDRERILAAARRLLADRAAGDVTVAEVAVAAGVDDATILRHFGSRRGVEHAVITELAARVDRSSERLRENGPATFDAVLAERRDDPIGSRLLTRCALGQMDIAPLLSVGNYVNGLTRWIEAHRGRRRGAVPVRTRLCVFGAMSTLLGWISYSPFLTTAFGLDQIDPAQLSAVVAESAGIVATLALAPGPELRKGLQSVDRSAPAHTDQPSGRRYNDDGDVDSVLDDAARLAHGTFDGERWFDLAGTVRLVRHDSPVARRLAGAIADEVPVDAYRSEFPVLTAMLEVFAARDDLRPVVADGDHRLAFAAGFGAVLGSTLWDRPLRHATGIGAGVDVDPSVVSFLRVLGGFPDPTKPVDRD